MKLKNKSLLFTVITLCITLGSVIVSHGCGGGFGEDSMPELLRK